MEDNEYPISDPHITSCQEMEEKRLEEEKAAVEELIQQFNTLIQETAEREEMINRETRILTQELAYEQNFVLVSEAAEGMITEDTREVTKQVMQLYEMVNQNIPYMQHLNNVLERIRTQNNATLLADPIFALIQKEAHIKRQLEELGVFVPPPSSPNYPEGSTIWTMQWSE